MGQGGQKDRLAKADAAARIRGSAPAVGGGEDLLLALSEQEDEQGLREAMCERGGVHLRCDDPFDGEAPCPWLRTFQTVSLRTPVNKVNGKGAGFYTSALTFDSLRSPVKNYPPSRYGARNALSAESISSGAVSATQWPLPGMTTLCTSSAASSIPLPTSGPQLSAPPIARTGIVSLVLLRCPFCTRVVSKTR